MNAVSFTVTIVVLSFASCAFARTNLFRQPNESIEKSRVNLPSINTSANDEQAEANSSKSVPVRGMRKRDPSSVSRRSWSMVTNGNPIVASNSAVRYLADLLPGELREARIPTSVIAFSEGKAPVLAELTSNSGKSYLVLGEATLERTSKRITIEFSKIRLKERPEVYAFKSFALADDGTLGLKGELHSGEAKYFLAELASAAAAGFADSTINRSTNALGNTIEEASFDTHSKKALSSAMAKSAERFSEKQKSVTEYSLLEGPVTIQILIQDQPKMTHEGGK